MDPTQEQHFQLLKRFEVLLEPINMWGGKVLIRCLAGTASLAEFADALEFEMKYKNKIDGKVHNYASDKSFLEKLAKKASNHLKDKNLSESLEIQAFEAYEERDEGENTTSESLYFIAGGKLWKFNSYYGTSKEYRYELTVE